jgi:hypothetical protein
MKPTFLKNVVTILKNVGRSPKNVVQHLKNAAKSTFLKNVGSFSKMLTKNH